MPPLCITSARLTQAVEAVRCNRSSPTADQEEDVEKLRLDQLLVTKGLFVSREQAHRAVMAGAVKVDTRIAAKPSQLLDPDAEITLKPGRKSQAAP
jgi:ribosomal 50S subunit-recycling heat shock protein